MVGNKRVVVILSSICCVLIIGCASGGKKLSHEEQKQMDVLNQQMSEAMQKDGEEMQKNAEEMQDNQNKLKKNADANHNSNSTEGTQDSRVMGGRTSSFERFDSKFLGHKYYASGVADVVGNDDNAILVTITSSKDVNVVIKGNIEYESGEADLYLVNPDRNEECILPGDSIKENKKINKKVVLEAGSNEIILKGDRSVVDFDLEFITEGNGASISYDN